MERWDEVTWDKNNGNRKVKSGIKGGEKKEEDKKGEIQDFGEI